MKKRYLILPVLLVLLLVVWILWFGGFRIFGTLSELDDDGILRFAALNFVDTDGIGGTPEENAAIIRGWLGDCEKDPTTEFVYGSATNDPAAQVKNAFLRYYYGLGPVKSYPPQVDAVWYRGGEYSKVVQDPNGIVGIICAYHPGIPFNLYFPPVTDRITFRVQAEEGSLTSSQEALQGEFKEYELENQSRIYWQDWDLDANAPWTGEETWITVTMCRNGIPEYEFRCRVYPAVYADGSTEYYDCEVTEMAKLTNDPTES